MVKKANIYIDCKGNVETDVYYKEEEIPQLKSLLESFGYHIEYVGPHKESDELGKPFIDKPRIMKTIAHDVNWHNPKIIFKVLEDIYKDDDVLLKELLIESGIDPEKSNATSFTIIARARYIFKEYEKWKTENKVDENNKNRSELHKKFSEFYVEEEKKRKQKRLQPGIEVYIIPTDKKGIIKEYKEERGIYVVDDEEGYSAYYKRKDLKVEEEPD